MTIAKLIREHEKKVGDCDTLLADRSQPMREDTAAINARRQAYIQIVHDLQAVQEVVGDTHVVDLHIDEGALHDLGRSLGFEARPRKSQTE